MSNFQRSFAAKLLKSKANRLSVVRFMPQKMIKKFALTIALLGLADPVGAMPITFATGDHNLRLKPMPISAPVPVSAKTLRQKAADALSDMDFELAVQYLDQALAQNPNDSDLKQELFNTLQIGGSTHVDGRPLKAIPLLKRAVAMRPQDFFVWSRLGDAYCSYADYGPTSRKARPYIQNCIAAHKRAIALATNKPKSITRFAIALSRIEPVASGKLFDLAARGYLQAGDQESARGALITKSAFGVP
jgi:tetratricopeptide (TPR) repeat protein